MSTPTNPYLGLATKLKRLADESGYEGERTNAKAALDALMKKRGISISDLNNETLIWQKFKFKQSEKLLFVQVLVSVVGSNVSNYMHKRTGASVMVTKQSAIEIDLKFDHYKRLYRQEQKTLFTAFLYKHDLFSKDPATQEPKKLSQKEIEDLQRASKMAMTLQDAEFIKQINKQAGAHS